ncbi:MAG: FAD-dependent oxidoreductase [Pseudomonadales bacterium]|nr:FAD-dependent oxidoreductase [Pseudomonadales bacterium]
MNQDYDVVVIGAGIAGLSAAAFISSGARVLVLERESQPAYHSSGRSASVYIEGYENPVVAALTKASGDFFRSPPAGFSDDEILHPRGGLTAAKPGEEAVLAKYIERWGPLCPSLRAADRDETLTLSPILRPESICGGAWDPTWMSIDTHALVLGYQRLLRKNGGTVVANTEITALNRTGLRWTVNTQEQTYQCDTVVNAAGSWAGSIGEMVGLSKPLTPMRRTGIILKAPDEVTSWPLVHMLSGDLYFKPESPGLMVCPGDETPTVACDAQPEELDIAIALDRFQNYTDMPIGRPMHTWAGLRTFAPDRYPILGFDKSATGFFWLAGQGGFGVQTSPEMGRLAGAIVTGKEPVPTELDANRF